MKSSVLVLAFFCAAVGGSAQTQPGSAIRALTVGDTVPDMAFTNIINYHSKTARLSDFKDKIVIMDFWATWCGACIAQFPKMDSIQEKLKDQLQFILINSKNTGNTEKSVSIFLEKRKGKAGSLNRLISTIEDSISGMLFPHMLIPHYVWIGSDRVVKAITSSDQITKENIVAAISGNTQKIQTKKDRPINLPLDLTEAASSIKFRSLFTGNLNGLPTGRFYNEDSNRLITRVCLTNSTMIGLYREAYSFFFSANRIVFGPRDSTNKNPNTTARGINDAGTYCYELICPPSNMEKVIGRMKYDLEYFFGFTAYKQKNLTQCLVIKKIGKLKAPTSNANGENNLKEIEDHYFIRNQPISVLTDHLNCILKIPVLDETNFPGNIDINFERELTDIKALRATLLKYGFDLVETEREIEVFMLVEKP